MIRSRNGSRGGPAGGKLHFKPRPDEHGLIHGVWQQGDAQLQVIFLAPAGEWQGKTVLPDHEPNLTRWIVFAYGEEVARVEAKSLIELEAALRTLPADDVVVVENRVGE